MHDKKDLTQILSNKRMVKFMTQPVIDARKAIKIAKDFALISMNVAFWKDVLVCEIDEKTKNWRVVFEASPGLLAPYHKYEIIIDSNTGNVKKARKIE